MQGLIYLIINIETGHKYVGNTTQTLNKEWKHHIECAKRMSGESLHCAMRKYGNHLFNIKQIDECNTQELEDKTNYWIGRYNSEYNNNLPIVEKKDIKSPFVIKKDNEVVESYEPKKPKYLPTFTDETRGNGKHSGIRIQGLNIETGELKVWDNARMAAEELAGNPNRNANILLSARKGYVSYGYRWKLLEHKSKKKAVKGINKVTWEEIFFESRADVIRRMGNGTHGSTLTKALKSNGRYTWRGYMWFYV